MTDRELTDGDLSDAHLLHSPLDDRHRALGATMGAFGGWDMPISYAGAGVVAEHTAVRTSVGVFDVSHLGKATVTGPGAAAFVNACLTADLDQNRSGSGPVHAVLQRLRRRRRRHDRLPGVRPDEVFLDPERRQHGGRRRRAAGRGARTAISVTDRHRDFGVLAVQGPASAEVLAALGLPADLEYMSWVDADLDGAAVRVCRTGYTGEHGYELVPSWADAAALWDAITHEVGAARRPARRARRPRHPAHGDGLRPARPGPRARHQPRCRRGSAGPSVGASRSSSARTRCAPRRSSGPDRVAWGLLALDRGVLRSHLAVLDADGERIGETTSGTFSPTLGQGIALALIDTAAGVAVDDEVAVDVRGRRMRVRVVKPPFVPSHVR